MSEPNVTTSGGEFNIPMDLPEAEQPDVAQPATRLSETLDALSKMAGLPAPGEKAEPEPEPAAKEEPAGDPEPSEIDNIMAALEDEPQAIKDAVRAALEKGVKLEAALNEINAERAEARDATELKAAEDNLVAEVSELAERYPGFTEEDLRVTLTAISKMPKATAEALTFEEAATRALGRDVLESRRTGTPALGGRTAATPAGRTADPAVIIGDATPGPGAAEKPFDAGSGGDFMDIANHITKHAGASLVSR